MSDIPIEKKYNKLLKFVKTLVEDYDENFILDTSEYFILKGYKDKLYKAHIACIADHIRAKYILKEIGESFTLKVTDE